MRGWTVIGMLVAIGCGGDKTTTDECEETEVAITVVDTAGAPVEGAAVTLGEFECTDDGGGVYGCTAPSGEEYVASVDKTPDFNVFSETVVLEAGACTHEVTFELPPPLVY